MPILLSFLFLLIGFIISLFTFELVFISSSLTSTMPIPLSIKYNNLSMTCETFGKRQQNKHYIPLIGVVCWHKTDINAKDTCWVGNYCLWFLRMTLNLNLWKPRIFTFYGLTLSRRTFSAVIVAASSKKPVMAPREIEDEGQFKQLKILALWVE